MSVRNFVSKNLVAIVCVPIIIVGHYTWYRIQQVDTLVNREDRQRLPFASWIFGSGKQMPKFIEQKV